MSAPFLATAGAVVAVPLARATYAGALRLSKFFVQNCTFLRSLNVPQLNAGPRLRVYERVYIREPFKLNINLGRVLLDLFQSACDNL